MKNVIVLNIQFEYDGISHEIHPVILRNEVETYIWGDFEKIIPL